MSRLVAYMGSDPERLSAVLQQHRDLLQGAASGPADTVCSLGVGFYQGGEVLLQRRPRLSGGTDLFEGVKDLRTDVFLAQLQDGVPGKLAKSENTPPYRFRSWLMAPSGPLRGFEKLQEALSQSLPDFLRRNIRGQTPGEQLFHLYLAALHEAGRSQLEDANLPPELALRALSSALSRVTQLAREKDVDLGPLQIALSNGRLLVVAQTSAAAPLWFQRLAGLPEKQNEHLRGVLVIGTGSGIGPDGTPAPDGKADGKVALEPLPVDHALLVGRDLQIRIVPLNASKAG